MKNDVQSTHLSFNIFFISLTLGSISLSPSLFVCLSFSLTSPGHRYFACVVSSPRAHCCRPFFYLLSFFFISVFLVHVITYSYARCMIDVRACVCIIASIHFTEYTVCRFMGFSVQNMQLFP